MDENDPKDISYQSTPFFEIVKMNREQIAELGIKRAEVAL